VKRSKRSTELLRVFSKSAMATGTDPKLRKLASTWVSVEVKRKRLRCRLKVLRTQRRMDSW